EVDMDDTLAKVAPGIVMMLIPVMAVSGSFAVVLLWIYAGIRRRDLAHRERLAMIEKGLVPPAPPQRPENGSFSRRSGITLIGIGLGLALFFFSRGWATNTREAMAFGPAIGGMFVLFGVASLVNAAIDRRKQTSESPEPKSPEPKA